MTPADRPFVATSWVQNYRKHAGLAPQVYAQGAVPLIDMLLHRCPTVVAYFDDTPDEILGWATTDGDVLHYVYVKAAYRHQGIGSSLTEGTKWHTHRNRHLPPEQFNPYLLHAYFLPETP